MQLRPVRTSTGNILCQCLQQLIALKPVQWNCSLADDRERSFMKSLSPHKLVPCNRVDCLNEVLT